MTPLNVSIAACVIATFAPEWSLIAPLVQSLVDTQRDDRGWSSAPLYAPCGVYWDSEELTTGFCVEALSRAGNAR